MGRALTIFLLGLVLAVGIRNTCLAEENVIRIGFNIAQTGMFELVGKNAINAGELVRQDIEKAGGLTVGGKSYKVELDRTCFSMAIIPPIRQLPPPWQ